MKDDLGDRMKAIESHSTLLYFPSEKHIYVRLDGRSFSKFTRGKVRPFDHEFAAAMRDTCQYLVTETNAAIGYVQSDEISLVYPAVTPPSQHMFDGKYHKLTSILAAMATAKFMSVISDEDRVKLPHFDARVVAIAAKVEVANMFLWRTLDASRNAISMLAQHNFSHKELQKKSTREMVVMLAEIGVFMEDQLSMYRYGSFFKRVTREVDPSTLNIPVEYLPDGPVLRSFVEEVNCHPFVDVTNRVDVIFNSAEPAYK